MGILSIIALFFLGVAVGVAIILIPRSVKLHAPKNKCFSQEEMQSVTTYKDSKPASSNEEYSYVPPYIHD